MSEPKFSAGPYSIREVSDPTQRVYLIESSTGAVALVQADGPEATATVHLLKAAPNLFAALYDLLAAAEAAHWPITAEQIAPLENARSALAEAVPA